MKRYLFTLVALTGCERANPTPEETTSHYLWYPARVGDTYTYTNHGESTVTIDGVERKGEYFRDLRSSTLEVANERKAKERIDVTRDDHTRSGPSLVGTFELVGDPITSIRRLDGELSPAQRKDLMDGRGDCSPADGHVVAQRIYRVNETVRVADGEANCMGFTRSVPGSLEMTLRSVNGATVAFDFIVDYAARDGMPQGHDTGSMTFSESHLVRIDNLVMAEGNKSLRGHSETTVVFTRGPEK